MRRVLLLVAVALMAIPVEAQTLEPLTLQPFVGEDTGEQTQLFGGNRRRRRNPTPRQNTPPEPGQEGAPAPADEPPPFVTGEDGGPATFDFDATEDEGEEAELTEEQWASIFQIIKLIIALFGGAGFLGGIQVALRKRAASKLEKASFLDVVKRFQTVATEAKDAQEKKDTLIEVVDGLVREEKNAS